MGLALKVLNFSYLLIRKIKRKQPYLFPIEKCKGRANEFCVGIVYSFKLQPFQVIFTSRSRKCKNSRKTVYANDIQLIYRVM